MRVGLPTQEPLLGIESAKSPLTLIDHMFAA